MPASFNDKLDAAAGIIIEGLNPLKILGGGGNLPEKIKSTNAYTRLELIMFFKINLDQPSKSLTILFFTESARNTSN